MVYTDPELLHSALITIDTQCDFSLPGAPAEVSGTHDAIPNMKRLLETQRRAGLPVIHIVRLYLSDGSNADLCRKEMIESGQPIVRPETGGAELVAVLKPTPGVKLDAGLLFKGKVQEWNPTEFVIYKSRWGAFYKTPLNDHLQKLDVNTLVFCGCNFPNCLRASIYEASEKDYKLILIDDAVSGLYGKGKEELRNIGVHIWSTDTFLGKMNTETVKLPALKGGASR